MKKYAVREEISNEEHQQFGEYPILLKKLLAYRGIKTAEQAEAFLNPDYEKHLHDPFLIKDMDKAVVRILRALESGEKIVIFGDYDADGIPGGVILHDFFKKIGFANFENYIPHRHNEGFGLNKNAIKQFIDTGAKLLITVDCGIGNLAEVALANEGDLDVIITDHHQVNGHGAPPALAIVNPNQPGCEYPNKSLCGAGVAFKLVQALLLKLETCNLKLTTTSPIPKGWEKWLLDMAGLATLSDMVALTGENRAIAHYGLKVLRKSPRVGLLKLLRKLKISQRTLNEDDIGFMISPRINAASRMGEPWDAFRLFATTDEVEADQVSDHLNKINDERKGIVASMVKEMKHAVEKRYVDKPKKVIVLGNPNWRPSLLGLAANTLAEENSCPVFLWGRDGDNVIKGSCRSDGVTSLVGLMSGVSRGVFIEYGGHDFSGGFSVVADKVHMLEAELTQACEKAGVNAIISEAENFVDARLDIDDANWHNWELVEKLAPFGVGNPKPLFLFEAVRIFSTKQFGKEKNHLELIFKNSRGAKVSAIGFFMKPEQFKAKIVEGAQIDLIATMEKSVFKQYPELRLRIVDIV